MSVQLVKLDYGRHNESPEESSARILKGASWKRQRIIKVVPAAATISAKIALSHECLIYPPNNGVVRMLAQGVEVGEAYTAAIESILETPELRDWEYVLTCEHDNCPPSDGVLKLIESMDKYPKYSAISGLYWTKGYGGVAQIWGDPQDPVVNFRPQVPVPDTVQECCGIGMGFALFRLKMFKNKKLRKPWFKTISSAAEGVGSQDLYFWSDARKHGHRCAVDTRVKVGHLDLETDIMW